LVSTNAHVRAAHVLILQPVPEFYPRHSLLIAPNKGANKGVHAPVTGARIDHPVPVMFTASTSLTAAVAETSAAAAVVPAPKDSPRKQRLSFTSRVPPIDTKEVVEPVESSETSAQRGNILERLRRFFRTRPTLESLKEKGIYKRKCALTVRAHTHTPLCSRACIWQFSS
jgi:hypothetical protein